MTVHFFSVSVSMANRFKKVKVKLDLLTDINFLLMVDKGIKSGVSSHAIRLDM